GEVEKNMGSCVRVVEWSGERRRGCVAVGGKNYYRSEQYPF
nr:hypothetical protein [Tanacetum cinerariifolium]